MKTLTAPLSEEHQVVLVRLETFEKALGAGDWAGIEATLAFFEKELPVHRRKEEEVLFPALAPYMSLDQGPVHCMLAEHADELQKITSIRTALGAGRTPEALGRIRKSGEYILGLLRSHIAKEDQILYPMAEDLLKEGEQTEVRRRMEAIGFLGQAGTAR